MTAIRDACRNVKNFDLSGAELYTTSYPCPMCLGAIMWARISKVYYCCTTKDAERIGFADDNFYADMKDEEKMAKFILFDKESFKECNELFDVYDKSDKIPY